MPVDFPLISPGHVDGDANGSTITASATPNVKGAWVELWTSTTYDASGLLVQLNTNGASAGDLVDIGIGGAGSEVALVSNLLISHQARLSTWFHVPASIPAGSRVAGRMQSTSAGHAGVIVAHLMRGGIFDAPAGRIVTMGADTSDSGGTSVDPGATINTYGAWSQLSASTPGDIAAVWLLIGGQQNTAPTDQAANFHLQLGIGGAGSEVVVWGPVRFGSSSAGTFGPLPAMWFPLGIPAGSRLAVRARAAINDATDRKFDIVAYGLVI